MIYKPQACKFITIPVAIILISGCSPEDTPKRFDLLSSGYTGIDFSNNVEEAAGLNPVNYINFYNGGGVAAGVYGGPHDASYGWFLKGDGAGQFKAVGFEGSGFFVPGQTRDIKILKTGQGKSRILVARNDNSLLIDRKSVV